MASYSTNALVQNTVYKAVNAELDTGTAQARQLATSIINSKLGLKKDMTTVPQVVTDAATLIASSILATGPENDFTNLGYYKAGMALLDQLGEETTEGSKYNTISIERFGGYSDTEHDPTIPQL